MEIIKHSLYISDKNIYDVKIVSVTTYVLFSYKLKIDNNIKYIEYIPNNQYEIYIYFELYNNFPLWNIEYKISDDILFTIYMDLNLLHDLLYTSIGINYILNNAYTKLSTNIKTNLKNISYIVYNEPIIQPSQFKLKLYDYQLKSINKMLNIENNITVNKIFYHFPIKLDDITIYYDPIFKTKTNNELEFIISTKGGILSDDMGLGKTITTIGLITVNPYIYTDKIKLSKNNIDNKLCIKATLIICPSHLIEQWKNEIKRCNESLKILLILTKTQHMKLHFSDFYEADIILTSLQFIMNFKYYPTLNYKNCNPSTFDFNDRNYKIYNILNQFINKPLDEIKTNTIPLFEYFIFNRLLLDESHEIFGELLNNLSLSRYIAEWITNIDANYYWYISGTPFINNVGLYNCSKFINLRLLDKERNINFDINKLENSNYLSKNIKEYINKDYIWSNILNKICIRHRKEDVENQVQIPGFTETIIWVKFTDLENNLYNSKKKNSELYLQKLCCHPLILDSNRRILGNIEVDLSIMKDKLINFHKTNLDKYLIKLETLDLANQAYHMLKKSYETQISESKYMINILEKIEKNELISEDGCIICMDEIKNPTLTTCGHLYCYECIKLCLQNKKICPLCKTNLVGKDLMLINKKTELDINNPLIQKYGSKLGKLISMIRALVSLDETRIIVFSQWDDMLSLIGSTLVENGIENSFIKGNVYCRNAAISKFKSGKSSNGNDNKVIMLSLKNSASGTNLTEATHIFFVEPINSSKEECKIIESQAIARACRIGQKKKISVIRILIENTIEETIYKRNYN